MLRLVVQLLIYSGRSFQLKVVPIKGAKEPATQAAQKRTDIIRTHTHTHYAKQQFYYKNRY